MITLRLFAQARESAGMTRLELERSAVGDTVGDVLDEAVNRFGQPFADVLAGSRVWVNGSPAERATAIDAGDEVAVLPPVSGG